jgi:hypothetical protein
MLSLERCRQIDPEMKNISDEELLAVVENLYEMAQLALEKWECVSKNPIRVLSDNSSSVE